MRLLLRSPELWGLLLALGWRATTAAEPPTLMEWDPTVDAIMKFWDENQKEIASEFRRDPWKWQQKNLSGPGTMAKQVQSSTKGLGIAGQLYHQLGMTRELASVNDLVVAGATIYKAVKAANITIPYNSSTGEWDQTPQQTRSPEQVAADKKAREQKASARKSATAKQKLNSMAGSITAADSSQTNTAVQANWYSVPRTPGADDWFMEYQDLQGQPSEPKMHNGQQYKCAWQALITGRSLNAAYPDMNAVYNTLVVPDLTDKMAIRVTGEYPIARYFSFQTNNQGAGFGLRSLRDYQVQPISGFNPYANTGDEEFITDKQRKETNTWQMHVTLKGQDGRLNELGICTEGGNGVYGGGSDTLDATTCTKGNAVLIYRIYTADPKNPARNALNLDPERPSENTRIWGYVAPPKVEILAKKGKKDANGKWSGDQWSEIPLCDPNYPNFVGGKMEDRINANLPDDIIPELPNLKNNMIVYQGAKTSSAGIYPNLDAAYFFANAYQKGLADTMKGRIIAKVTGQLPTHALALDSPTHRIADWKSVDLRYISLSTLAYVRPAPTIDTLCDVLLETKFPDGRYSVVAAQDKEFAAKCKFNGEPFYDPDKHLFLNTTVRGEPVDMWGFIYRQIVSRYQRDGTPDKSVAYARDTCQNIEDGAACNSRQWIQEALGSKEDTPFVGEADVYPYVTWYVCDPETNEVTELTEELNP